MKTICLVDDDDIFKMIFKKGLELSGLPNPVLDFNDGHTALEHFETKELNHTTLPEVIFLDIKMYNTDGWEFLAKFQNVKKRFTRKIDIYIVSNSIRKNDIERSKNFPDVIEYLVKPVSLQKIQAILE